MKTLFARIRLGHVALVLVGVVIGLAVGATVLPDSDETVSSAVQVNTDPPPPPVVLGLPGADTVNRLYDTDPWFRRVWVRGCVASGESAAFCRCAITEYKTRLQPWEFEAAHAVAHSNGRLAELPEHVREVVKDVEQGCR
jgi:hypothetical protein